MGQTATGETDGPNAAAAPAWSLGRLVAPSTVERFYECLCARRPTTLPSTDPARFKSLIDWESVASMFTQAAIPCDSRIVVTRNGAPVPPMFYSAGASVDGRKLLGLVDNQHSLIVKNLQTLNPGIAQLVRAIATDLNERVSASIVSTTGPGGALKLHYDTPDVLAIQLEGVKRWSIQDQPFVDPVPATPRTSPPEGRVMLEVDLRPGDMLLVPAGYWHRCINHEARSVHLAVLFLPPCVQNVLSTIARACAHEPQLRKPIGRQFNGAELAGAAAAIRNAMLRRLEEMTPEEMLRTYLNQESRPGDY